MAEHRIQQQILAAIGATDGALVWRNNTGAARDGAGRLVRFGTPGAPDIMAIVGGQFVGLEVKSARGKLSKRQEAWRKACEAAGGIYRVCRSVDDALAAIDEARRRTCETRRSTS